MIYRLAAMGAILAGLVSVGRVHAAAPPVIYGDDAYNIELIYSDPRNPLKSAAKLRLLPSAFCLLPSAFCLLLSSETR